MPLNILFDARSLVEPASGGVRRVATMLLDALLAADPDLRVICTTTGIRKPALPEPFASHSNVTHVHIRVPNKVWSALVMIGMVSLDKAIAWRRMAFGVWYLVMTPICQTSNAKPQTPNAIVLPNLGFVGRLRVPYALILHDLSFLIEPRWFPLKMRLWHIAVRPKETARRASRIFCVSETTARDAERLLGIPREKIRVFSPGIPVLPSQTTLPQPTWQGGEFTDQHGARFLIVFGERDPRKNVATAIAAIEMLRRNKKYHDVKLIIIGSGAKISDQQSTAHADIPPNPKCQMPRHRRVHLWRTNAKPHDFILRLPSVSDAELASLYEHASAVLYPSWYEGFGLPLHEAARYGTPCIASTMGALPETAPAGTVFAPPSKPHLWASMIRDILDAPDQYRTRFNEHATKTDIAPIVEWLKKTDR